MVRWSQAWREIVPSVHRSILIPARLDREISRAIQHRGAGEWSTGVITLLEEAVRASRIPGIIFVQSREGRRAAVAFAGLEVWEIVATWKEAGKNSAALAEAYPELSAGQLCAALAYYHAYPEDIDGQLEREAHWTPERVAEELPFTR